MKMKIPIALAIVSVIALSAAAYAVSQPDLTVADIAFTQNKRCGNSSYVNVTVRMFVRNIGNATAYNFGDQLNITGSITTYFVSSLGPGLTTSHARTVAKQCGVSFWTTTKADINNTVSESNEANNFRSETYTPV